MSGHDVIVIGGGFTGLSAATSLAAEGCDVLLLEARNRVGGRVESAVLPGGLRIDTGGQFLCYEMPEVMALALAHGKTLVRTYLQGEETYQPPMAPARGDRIGDEVDALRERMAEIDLDDPSIAGLTVAGWIARQDADADTKDALTSLVNGYWCLPPEEISLAYLASAERRIVHTGTELDYSLGETMHSLAEDLAAALGDRVRLQSPVTRIVHSADEVEVFCGAERFTAGRAIVALPPVMVRRLAFEPALPADLTRALAAWKSGGVVKLLVRYAQPFWRKAGLSGMVIWRQPQGLFACDASRGDDAALVVFAGGALSFAWHDKGQEALKRFVIEKLSAALGPAAAEPLDISLRDWVDDEWSGGAYGDMVGDLTVPNAEAPLLAGTGPIRFASSELASTFPGYIEGAIVAGRKAAAEILDDLGRR